MQRNKNNYWNLYAKKEHTHENYSDINHNHHGVYLGVNELNGRDNHVGIPRVGVDGVIELGQYIDMHSFESGKPKNDYDVRIVCTNPRNDINGWGTYRVYCREATFGNDPRVFAMGHSIGANDGGLTTDKYNAVLGASHAIFLKANNFFDGVNDIHYDKNKGASQLFLETNQYPKFRWSSYPEQGYGIAQWSPLYEILTSHEGQQVVMGRGWIQAIDFNNMVNSGVYPCYIGDCHNAPATYQSGILIIFTSADNNFVVQMYVPHSTSPPCTRVRWNDGTWSPWRQTCDSPWYSEMQEMNERISALEETATYSRKRLKKVRRLRRSMI